MYYEITALSGDNEVVIQSTKNAQTGSQIGMRIEPDGIHVMSAGTLINVFEGNITKEGKVAFAGGEYDCDLTQLYGGAYLKEESILVIADGEELDLSGHEVIVEVPVKAVSMSDDPDEGGACGNIVSFIYKGNHYNYTVRTSTEDDFVLDEDDLWNENDYVSLVIPRDEIRLKFK